MNSKEFKHPVELLHAPTRVIRTLTDFGITSVTQIENWTLPQLSNIKGIEPDEAYKLYLAIQKYISGKPTTEHPKEFLCLEWLENEVCSVCEKEGYFQPAGLYYPEGLKALAFDVKQEPRRYKECFVHLEKDSTVKVCPYCLNKAKEEQKQIQK